MSFDNTQMIPWPNCIALEMYITRMDKAAISGPAPRRLGSERMRLAEQIADLLGKPYRTEPPQSAMDHGTLQ